jgi:hypothetical protein
VPGRLSSSRRVEMILPEILRLLPCRGNPTRRPADAPLTSRTFGPGSIGNSLADGVRKSSFFPQFFQRRSSRATPPREPALDVSHCSGARGRWHRLISRCRQKRLCRRHTQATRTLIEHRPPQRATTRNGALWENAYKSSLFGPPPPTARQIENWQPVVYFP